MNSYDAQLYCGHLSQLRGALWQVKTGGIVLNEIALKLGLPLLVTIDEEEAILAIGKRVEAEMQRIRLLGGERVLNDQEPSSLFTKVIIKEP